MAIKRYETGGGVVIHDDKILLLDRPMRNEIRLPKGHIDPGETPQVAALRETTEETGYAALQIVAELGAEQVEFDNEGDHYIRHEHYFLIRLTGLKKRKRSKSDEKQFFSIWVEMNDAIDRLTFAAEKQVVQKALTTYASLPE